MTNENIFKLFRESNEANFQKFLDKLREENEANIDNDDTNELCSSTEKSAEKEVC